MRLVFWLVKRGPGRGFGLLGGAKKAAREAVGRGGGWRGLRGFALLCFRGGGGGLWGSVGGMPFTLGAK